MYIIAKSIKGQEFFYNLDSAHKVSKNASKKILKTLNDIKWTLKDNEVWFIHEVDRYDNAYYTDKKFTLRKGVLKEKYI